MARSRVDTKAAQQYDQSRGSRSDAADTKASQQYDQTQPVKEEEPTEGPDNPRIPPVDPNAAAKKGLKEWDAQEEKRKQEQRERELRAKQTSSGNTAPGPTVATATMTPRRLPSRSVDPSVSNEMLLQTRRRDSTGRLLTY